MDILTDLLIIREKGDVINLILKYKEGISLNDD